MVTIKVNQRPFSQVAIYENMGRFPVASIRFHQIPCWSIPRLVPKALRSLVVRTNGGSNWKFESQNGPLEVFHQAVLMGWMWEMGWDGIDEILSSPEFTPEKTS